MKPSFQFPWKGGSSGAVSKPFTRQPAGKRQDDVKEDTGNRETYKSNASTK